MNDQPNNTDFPFRKEKEKPGLNTCRGCCFEAMAGLCFSELAKHKIVENLGSCGDEPIIYIKKEQ